MIVNVSVKWSWPNCSENCTCVHAIFSIATLVYYCVKANNQLSQYPTYNQTTFYGNWSKEIWIDNFLIPPTVDSKVKIKLNHPLNAVECTHNTIEQDIHDFKSFLKPEEIIWYFTHHTIIHYAKTKILSIAISY